MCPYTYIDDHDLSNVTLDHKIVIVPSSNPNNLRGQGNEKREQEIEIYMARYVT